MANNDDLHSMNQTDEIDLLELFFSVWRKKNIVIACLITGLVLSFIYTRLAPEKWTSNAEIIAPNTKDIESYFLAYSRYHAVIEPKKVKKIRRDKELEDEEDSSEVDINEVFEKMFATFASAAGSNEKQIKFWSQSGAFKRLIELGEDNRGAALQLSGLIEVEKPVEEGRKGNDFLSIELSAEKPDIAQMQLQEFIHFVNDNVVRTMNENLRAEIKTKIRSLKIQKDSIEKYTDLTRSVRLENLKNAQKVAQRAGVKDYALRNSSQRSSFSGNAGIQLEDNRLAEGNFLFLLGENYLTAQIETLKDAKVVYPEEYYQSELQIKLLSDLLKSDNQSGYQAFHYQSSPSLPLTRAKPKKVLILIGGVLIGFIVGVFLAIFLVAIEGRSKQNNAQ